MANWGIKCNCGGTVIHSAIDDTLANFIFPEKPEFPLEGVLRMCPHCSAVLRYHKHELIHLEEGRPSRRLSPRNRTTLLPPSGNQS